MEKCPQCDAERFVGESFCDNCGHKYTATYEPEQPQESLNNSQSLVDAVPADELSQQEKEVGEHLEVPEVHPIPRGAICIQNVKDSKEYPLYFEDAPRIIGRRDVSSFLTDLNIDPLQFSRTQCTIFKENSEYYIEDGITSIQDKPSGNHTTVNGQDITGQGKIKLHENDQIVFATIANAIFRMM